MNVCIVRTDPQQGGKSGLSAIVVPRGTAGISYEQPISKLGHRLCQNNSILFENCRVAEENAFALGDGALVISKAFTWSGPVAAIAAVGVARSAYEYVLKWAKTYTAGGNQPILHHQAVGYLLAEVAMKIEACRAFSWKAAHYLDQYDSEGHAVGAMAKVFCGETLFNAVFRTMQAMDFDPRAIADTRPMKFTKSMEGVGTLIATDNSPTGTAGEAKPGRRAPARAPRST